MSPRHLLVRLFQTCATEDLDRPATLYIPYIPSGLRTHRGRGWGEGRLRLTCCHHNTDPDKVGEKWMNGHMDGKW